MLIQCNARTKKGERCKRKTKDFICNFHKETVHQTNTKLNDNTNEHLHNLSEQIFEIREKFIDEEYKNMMDSLQKLYDKQPKNQPLTNVRTSSPPVENRPINRNIENEFCSCCNIM